MELNELQEFITLENQRLGKYHTGLDHGMIKHPAFEFIEKGLITGTAYLHVLSNHQIVPIRLSDLFPNSARRTKSGHLYCLMPCNLQ